MPKKHDMDDDELRQVLAAEISAAVGYLSGAPAKFRQQALRYYECQLYGTERPDRSKVVTSEVRDVIESMMPQVIKLFCSSDDVVNFEPVEPDSPRDVQRVETMAKNATEYANHIFSKDNPGFQIIYTAAKDAMLFRNCAAKVWWEDIEIDRPERYEGLSDIELQALLTLDECELDKDETRVVTVVDPNTLQPMEITVHDVVVHRAVPQRRVRIQPVPLDELLVPRRTINLEDASFLAHRVLVSVSDLVEQGYDQDVLDEIKGPDAPEWSIDRVERFAPEGEGAMWSGGMGADQLDKVWINECYVEVDRNGDGKAERLKCVVSVTGERWLTKKGKPAIEDWTGPWPIVGGTGIMMPHKWHGMSIADMAMDIQRQSSEIHRQMMDNIYGINNNRLIANMDAIEVDDLLSNRPNQIIRQRGANNGPQVWPLSPDSLVGQLLPALEYLKEVGENRTGVTRYNQGLDANSLNQTATGIQQIMSAAQERVLLFARVFAETFVRPMFKRILQLICQHQTEPRMIKLARGWVPMDPREWDDQMNLSIRVGLGTGNKQEQQQSLGMLLNYQAQAMQAGSPIVNWQNIYHTACKLTEVVGYRDVESFWTDPSQAPQPQTQQPNPDVEKAKAQIAAAQIKAQQQAQSDALRAQTDLQKQAMIEQGKLVQHEIDAHTRLLSGGR